MLHIKVISRKLNKRNAIPQNFPEHTGIVGHVIRGYEFIGDEVKNEATNPALGKWYKDRDGYYYWGGGLIIEDIIPLEVPLKPIITLERLPVNIPEDFRLGIDVSHHNSNIDWDDFKNAGVSFVFIKLSEGVQARDPMAKTNALAAKTQNFKIGYYHFCHPDKRNAPTVTGDATAEAREVLDAMNGLPAADYPLVLDLEDWNGADTRLGPTEYLLWIDTFLNVIGKPCMIYSRKEYLDRKLPANHGLGSRTKLWLSIYRNDGANIKCPNGWNDWSIWQYTESASTARNRKFDANILKDKLLF